MQPNLTWKTAVKMKVIVVFYEVCKSCYMLDSYCGDLFSPVCDQIVVQCAIHHVYPVSQQTAGCQVSMQSLLPTSVMLL